MVFDKHAELLSAAASLSESLDPLTPAFLCVYHFFILSAQVRVPGTNHVRTRHQLLIVLKQSPRGGRILEAGVREAEKVPPLFHYLAFESP